MGNVTTKYPDKSCYVPQEFNSGQIIDYLYTTCSCLLPVDFIPRKDTGKILVFF